MERSKPPNRRRSYTFAVGEGPNQVKTTVGLYPDGKPCDVFMRSSKNGTFTKEIFVALSCAVSLGLQYGITIDHFLESFSRNLTPSEYCDISGIFDTIVKEYNSTTAKEER